MAIYTKFCTYENIPLYSICGLRYGSAVLIPVKCKRLELQLQTAHVNLKYAGKIDEWNPTMC